MAASPPPSLATTLAAVVSALDALEQALREQQVDALPALSEALARNLQQCQRTLQQSPKDATRLDTATRQTLTAVGTRLNTLQTLLQRQNNAVHRTLAALFPTEQMQAYSRLGQGLGASISPARSGQQTSLKA